MAKMRVARWGNSFAVRLPAELVRELGLEEGDLLDVDVDASRRLEMVRRERREEVLEGLRAFRSSAPEDFKFVREEANAR